MTYLRFSPDEYKAICCLCSSLDLDRCRPQFLRRLLVMLLAETLPDLAARIARLGREELKLLFDHLRQRPRAERAHGLTAEEFEAIAAAGGPLLGHARVARLLKRALVQQLREKSPELATKLERLSLRQFDALCEQVKERTRKKP